MVVVSPSFTVPAEGILMQLPSVKLIVHNDIDLGTATLYITEHNVVWGGGVGRQGGPSPTVSLIYQNISLHAIQRDPGPALILVINHALSLPEVTQQGGGDAIEDDDDDDFEADEETMTKLQFIPTDENDLEALFTAMNQGQSLNPDPVDEVDDDDDPYMDGEEFDEGMDLATDVQGEDEFEDAEESNMSADDAAGRLRQLRLENVNGAHDRLNDDAEEEIGE